MTPWRILIADDEPKIRAGLRNQIGRMGLDVVVCAEAEDGEIALELTERERPDIVLVDINMPFVNGLDFIRSISRTRQDIRIIVITGYDKFEYARAAVDLKVQAYLLKPIDLEELRRVLIACMNALESERAHSRHFEWAISQINERRDSLREAFLRDAVGGRLDTDEIQDFAVYFDFPRNAEMKLMVISPETSGGDRPWTHILRQYALQDSLEGIMPEGLRFYCLFCDDLDNVLLLYIGDDDAEREMKEIVRQTLGRNTDITVEKVRALKELAEAYDFAIERMTDHAALSPIVSTTKEYIAAHYADASLDLTKVAGALSVHPVYLSRLMKQELGMPFARYLTHVRIGHAVELMQDANMKIWQVAQRVGYSGPNYFSAAFKKVLGVSPAEYRAEGRQ